MRSFITFVLLCAFGTAATAQDQRDWQSLAQLKVGDSLRLSLKSGVTSGAFQTWTPQEVTVGKVTARKEDVFKIERYGGWGRGKRAAVGALIGFGGAFAIGAAVGGCHGLQVTSCYSRGALGGGLGVSGAMVGGAVGALLPHNNELIYSVK